ncbi:GNAT family N-acetyltransferase [Bifidobacterium choloepi]|uniref:GNAT family N-acetyltransferase n=1 Tax=Bifidobacterium choloepi TaxID=2614131 RepID=A0A6I5NIK9_9BIFI|nr:GNAT family N-acetyltransferase [Bifidobacterium choloepi]NEG70203.1 GNAT family N-acetyltransferase [Bifidobacterium choloepi]
MSEQVAYRTLQRDDYPTLTTLIQNAWHANEDCSDEQAHRIAEADLEYCLARTTTARVATIHDSVIGVILGRIDSRETRRGSYNKHHRHVGTLLFPLHFSKTGRKLVDRLKAEHEADRRMLEKAKREGAAYDAEIVLFIVDPAYRGQGIGGQLFDWMLGEFKAAGVKNYFLMTDTTSDFAFYDHQGMNLAQQGTLAYGAADDDEMNAQPDPGSSAAPAPQLAAENLDLDQHLRVLMYDDETDFSNEGVNPLGRG